ncbi:hypothetical protein Mapa_001323 [Marchantia paleacea]|nr:hypothetical protein Mapa_001323 [Marchantia paleacea]
MHICTKQELRRRSRCPNRPLRTHIFDKVLYVAKAESTSPKTINSRHQNQKISQLATPIGVSRTLSFHFPTLHTPAPTEPILDGKSSTAEQQQQFEVA